MTLVAVKPKPAPVETSGLAVGLPLYGRGGVIRAFAMVDAADFPAASHHRWFLGKRGYPYRSESIGQAGRTRKITLHRDLLGVEDPKQKVDHINRDRLDNRRENLRVVDDRANAQNTSSHRDSRSKYRGVDLHRGTGKWRARAMVDGTVHYLGYFKTEGDAADAAAYFREHNMPYSQEDR